MKQATRRRRGTGRDGVLLVALGLVLGACQNESTGELQNAGEDGDEVLAEAASALQEPTCVTVRRGVFGNIHDTFLSGDNPGWAPGSDWGMWTGRSSGGKENRSLLSAA